MSAIARKTICRVMVIEAVVVDAAQTPMATTPAIRSDVLATVLREIAAGTDNLNLVDTTIRELIAHALATAIAMKTAEVVTASNAKCEAGKTTDAARLNEKNAPDQAT